MIYRSILKNAWQILWKAKYLWFFGFFAALITNSGEVNLTVDNFSSLSEQSSFLSDLKVFYSEGAVGSVWNNIENLFSNFTWMSLILVLVFLALMILVLWIAVVAQGGLISGSYKEYRKQPSNFMTAFSVGKQNFWKILGVNVIGRVIIYGILFILGLPLGLIYLRQTSSSAQALYIIIAFIILIPLAIIISFLMKYAAIAVINKKENIKSAIKTAWQMFIKNWIISIEVAILMFLISLVAAIAMIILTIVLIVPLSLMFYVFSVLQVGGILFVSVVISILIFVALVFLVAAALSTYQMTCWVLLFDKLDGNQVYSKLARWVAGLGSKKREAGK